jgi:hypothetical protein
MSYNYPEEIPFVVPANRQRITGGEPEPEGSHWTPAHQDVDWIGWANQGGGEVPDDLEWASNPNQHQEEEGHN